MDNLIAVSSWALHRTIGVSYPDSPMAGPQGETQHSKNPLALLDLPAALRKHGYSAMQLCHFHLPSREPSFAGDFRSSLRESDIQLLTVLIDEGDITDPSHGDESLDWIESWVRTAANLGASRARVIAGKQPYSLEAMEASVRRLKRIADVATEVGVRIETENWFPLLATPAAVHELLDQLDGALGLCADFGNWPRPEVYDALPQIMPRAETCHAKFEFVSAAELDLPHAGACMKIAAQAAYTGPFVLVSGGAGESDWEAMEIQRDYIRRSLNHEDRCISYKA
jgi:sugar phosphate isomerase/epimerase